MLQWMEVDADIRSSSTQERGGVKGIGLEGWRGCVCVCVYGAVCRTAYCLSLDAHAFCLTGQGMREKKQRNRVCVCVYLL